MGSTAAIGCFLFVFLCGKSLAFLLRPIPYQRYRPQQDNNIWRSSVILASTFNDESDPPVPPPPPPPFVPKPLPVILGAGLFLFSTSVPNKDKEFAAALLEQSQAAMRADPTIIMELGQAIESGGVYSSLATTMDSNGKCYKQLVLQFQIEGGNAWAQGVAYGIQAVPDGEFRLVSLEVANMDATINGKPFEINL